jgi:hypothetical protein
MELVYITHLFSILLCLLANCVYTCFANVCILIYTMCLRNLACATLYTLLKHIENGPCRVGIIQTPSFKGHSIIQLILDM